MYINIINNKYLATYFGLNMVPSFLGLIFNSANNDSHFIHEEMDT